MVNRDQAISVPNGTHVPALPPNRKTPSAPRPMSLFGTLASLSSPTASVGGGRLASGGASGASGRLTSDDPLDPVDPTDPGTYVDFGAGEGWETVSMGGCWVLGRYVVGTR